MHRTVLLEEEAAGSNPHTARWPTNQTSVAPSTKGSTMTICDYLPFSAVSPNSLFITWSGHNISIFQIFVTPTFLIIRTHTRRTRPCLSISTFVFPVYKAHRSKRTVCIVDATRKLINLSLGKPIIIIQATKKLQE